MQLENPMTLSGIEPTTFQLLAVPQPTMPPRAPNKMTFFLK
jgi:hypothetical protein